MLSNMHTSVSSAVISELAKTRKSLIESSVCSPFPVKRKTLILNECVQIKQLKRPIAIHSFNKLEECIKTGESYPSSPFKTDKKVIKWDHLQDLQQEEQSFSKMVKSDELFNKTKHANIKQLRQQTKNPLGKEDYFPEKSLENLKFAKDSLTIFEELEKLVGPVQNEDIDDDLLIQKDLELLNELSF